MSSTNIRHAALPEVKSTSSNASCVVESVGKDESPNSKKSRTTLGIKNSRVGLLYYIVDMLLQLVSRSVFISYIGADVLGLNTTANNLLQFLNLAELGVGRAVAFSLYKPLANGDRQSIIEIIRVQGWMYKRIAIIVSIGAVIMMCFFPLIFKDMELPMWYAYASFGVLLYSALLTYFFNYKQIILSASQQEYKILYSYKTVMIVRSLAQILAMRFLPDGYVWWLALQVVFSTFATIALTRMVNKTFPYLVGVTTNVSREIRQKYSIILTKIKQIIFHKISAYVLLQTSPLIIYAFANLTMVAIYGNYMLIVNGLVMLGTAFYNGVSAGIGDLIAHGDSKRILSVFKEIFTSRFLMTSVFCFGVIYLGNAFVSLWVGPEYLFDNATLYVIIAILFIHLFRTVVDHFIQGYCLFGDIWAPIAESSLNIGLSILLGYYFGITGILSGVLISLLLIVCIWKPIYLFHWGMRENPVVYFGLLVKHMAVFIVVLLLMSEMLPYITPAPTTFVYWTISAIISLTLFGLVEGAILWVVAPEMKMFVSRIINIITKKAR